jgi:predicted ABC-type sugar transport system permease subunit
MVTIAKAVYEKSKVIVFDEPTALLTNEQVTGLFGLIKKHCEPRERRETVKSVETVSDRSNSWARLFSTVVKFFRTGFAEGILILILLAFFVILALTSPSFLTVENLSNLVRRVAIIGVVSVGETIVIISAGIDLSVCSIVGFSNIVIAMLLSQGAPIIPSIVITLVAGSALGVLNGVLIHDGGCLPLLPRWA